MVVQELASSYLAALQRADVDAVLDLFAPGAVVNSPLYGPLPATEFYPKLIADTRESTLTLLGVLEGHSQRGVPLVGFWFHFDWRLSSGTPAPFEVVDLAELDDDRRIRKLRIIYDTVDTRPRFEAETGTSWRPSNQRAD